MNAVTSTTQYPPNTYAGVCKLCGQQVEAGAGRRRPPKAGESGWQIGHVEGGCPAPVEVGRPVGLVAAAVEALPPIPNDLTDNEAAEIVLHLFQIGQLLRPPM
jgi:hypothetical protein